MATKKAKPKAQDSAKERKLDLFNEVFPAVTRRDFGFYDRLTEEQKKEFSPWLLQRWCTGVDDVNWQEYHIQAMNERTNLHMGDLTRDHKELLWMLIASTGLRKNFRRTFPGAPRGMSKDNVRRFLEDLYPLAGEQELDVLRSINDEAELKEVAEQMNVKRSDIKDMFG